MQKLTVRHAFLGFLVIAFLAAGGCGSAPPKVTPMEIASDAGEKAVAQFDANKDGKLDYDELAKAPGLRDAVARIKKLSTFRGPPPSESDIKSATISAEEINERVQSYKAGGTGRLGAACRVVRVNKKLKNAPQTPVEGAEVKYVPESFLGPGLTTGTGTTDKLGSARISQPSRGGSDPATGMGPGFYRVEITKGSEIPAKYNTDTTLGVEIAPDMTSSNRVFELDY